jgi:hypothetical protein
MPFPLPPRSPAVLASVLAAVGIALAAAGCGSHVTPLGPEPPPPRQLGSPIVLQPMRSEPATAAGRCPAGYVAAPVSSGGGCYQPFGTPLTITTAAVAPVPSRRPVPPGQQPGPPQYGFMITLPAAGRAALKAITTTVYDAQGYLDVSVARRIWLIPKVLQPFTTGQFEISVPSRNQASQLQRLLLPSG